VLRLGTLRRRRAGSAQKRDGAAGKVFDRNTPEWPGMTWRNILMSGGVLVASAGLAGCSDGGSSGEDAREARVTRVIDGDTVEMERLGKVRLIGVDAPEKERCYDDVATRFTRDRLEGQVVQYEIGAEPKDRYDRTLAYLSRQGVLHNKDLLSAGYAKVFTVPPNDKYEERFERAQREAKKTDMGLWYRCDRDAIRARRAAAQRRKEKAEERRIAAAARQAGEESTYEGYSGGGSSVGSTYEDYSGSGSSGGGSSGFTCIDGDGDGRCD
jgi:micrococcal nuclease